jgi:hypothetical protein
VHIKGFGSFSFVGMVVDGPFYFFEYGVGEKRVGGPHVTCNSCNLKN